VHRPVPAEQRRCCECRAQPKKTTQTKQKKRSQLPGRNKAPIESAERKKWEFFSPEKYREVPAWDVPWGWPTIVGGMLAWGVTFILTGVLAIPIGAKIFEVTSLKTMTPLQQSEIQLLDQVRPFATFAALTPPANPSISQTLFFIPVTIDWIIVPQLPSFPFLSTPMHLNTMHPYNSSYQNISKRFNLILTLPGINKAAAPCGRAHPARMSFCSLSIELQ
jgi:hypothetical protein